MERLPTIRELIHNDKDLNKVYVSDKVTDPITDFINEELLKIVKDIKMNDYKDVDGVKYKSKPKSRYYIQDEKVPLNYRKRWTKDDLKKLYKGIVIYGLNLQFLVYWMDHKFTRRQIHYKIKYEEKIRPHMINSAILRAKP